MSVGYCAREKKPCVRWVEVYFKDCLCNMKDDISFALGLISLVCWGLAEIPQIITNFRTKSSHGVSLAFLLTWIVGDVFNLVGCLLEPATLPTQFYTALLYAASTILLVFQTIYYDHIGTWRRRKQAQIDQMVEDVKEPLKPESEDSAIPIPRGSVKASSRREFHYTSARSFSGSGTPTFLRGGRSDPYAMRFQSDDSSSEDESYAIPRKKSTSQPRPIPRSAGYGTFLAVAANLPRHSEALAQACLGLTARRLLQEQGSESVFGQCLGWLMAAIYMGGRLPQIWLNIRRGSVEGLNPLMFIFALIANATYVGSILVRTIEWVKIKANLAWLLDAIVCVALDLFIILQYMYYRYFRRTSSRTDAYYNDFVEANKDLVS